MPPVVNRTYKMEALDATTEVGGIGEDVQVVLFSNVVTLTDATLPADLDLVVVAGMAAQTALTPSAAYDQGDGDIVQPVSTTPFVATSDVGLPITITGWAILNTAGTVVITAENLEEPVPIDQVGDGVDVSAYIPWGG